MAAQASLRGYGWARRKEKKEVPKATHMVEFKKQGVPTSLKVPADMVGKKAAELSTTSYGAAKVWLLLLEPAPARAAAGHRELSTCRAQFLSAC